MEKAGPARADATPARRSRVSRTAQIGIGTIATVVAARVVLGNFVVNEWEGWSTFVGNALAAVVEGLVLGGVVFGIVVRTAARSRGRRPAFSGCVLGVLAVTALAIPYSAPQPILGAGAVALGLVAPERGGVTRRAASAAIALGLLAIAVWLAFMAYAVATGDWPVHY